MGDAANLSEEGKSWEFFEEAPISLWKVDFSEVKACLDSLMGQGWTDLRAYFAGNPWEIDRFAGRTRVIDVNSHTLELFKAGSKQELYDGIGHIITRESRPVLLDELLAIAGGDRTFQGEMINRDLRGEKINVILKWAASPAGGDDYKKVMLALVDMTRRVEAEERLKESESLYRMLADNAQDLVCVFDTDFTRRYVSPSYEAVLGHKPEELLGKSIFTLLEPEEAETIRHETEGGSFEWSRFNMRSPFRHKEGDIVWVDTEGSPIYDEEGELNGMLMVSRVVTGQVEAEEKLRESEKLYRMLADNTQDLIAVNDARYVRTYVSPSYETVLGYKPEELLGRPVVSLLHPDDLEEARRIMAKNTSEGTTGVMRLRNRHRDGHYVWLESQGTPLFDEEGKPVGGLSVSRVVTEQVEAEEALRETNEQLKDFLSVAAHELRHPINLVQGYVGTLRDFQGMPDADVLEDIYSGVTRASGRLVRLVEELLEVSRIDQGRFIFEFVPGRPAALAWEAADELRTRGAGSTFEIRASEGLGTWRLDPDKFRQLMVILLENATNYSPEGAAVEVGLEVTGKGLTVSVSDRGRGVDDDERELIFQRFFQSDKPLYHSVPGLGMGLYIAREIVEGHGGEIRHEHRSGGGSIFLFSIPAND